MRHPIWEWAYVDELFDILTPRRDFALEGRLLGWVEFTQVHFAPKSGMPVTRSQTVLPLLSDVYFWWASDRKVNTGNIRGVLYSAHIDYKQIQIEGYSLGIQR